MLRGTTALIACASIACSISAQTPGPSETEATYYAIRVYGVMGGEGRALVVGPIHRENCARAKPVLGQAAENLSIPPNMPLQISDCLTQPGLTRALYAPFNCTPIDTQNLPHSPGVHLWVYYCHYL